MPQYQGKPSSLNEKKWLAGLSASYNVEANYETSNDLRLGAEFALLCNRWYVTAETYLMNMDFVERQKNSANFTFYGAYAQFGYLLNEKIQPAVRLDVLDRNGINEKGLLAMPALGFNYFFSGHNLKLQAMYQYLSKIGHASEFEANDDDNGMSEHQVCVQLQFAF